MLTDAARGGSTPRAPRSFGATLLLAAALACGGSAATVPGDATYGATLSGANERPPLATAGRGTATIEVRSGVATYVVRATGLSGAVTLAHIAIGDAETSAGLPIVRLEPAGTSGTSGTIATGTIDLRAPITLNNATISGDSLRALFERGTAYVNVHTTTYPGGEVRGQIVRQ